MALFCTLKFVTEYTFCCSDSYELICIIYKNILYRDFSYITKVSI